MPSTSGLRPKLKCLKARNYHLLSFYTAPHLQRFVHLHIQLSPHQLDQRSLRLTSSRVFHSICIIIPWYFQNNCRKIHLQRVEHDDFDKTMKKYLTTSPPLPSFNPTNEDFIDIRSCAALIIKLSNNDYHNRNTLLRSAGFQGIALEKILSICEHKKQVFVGKLKSFEIPHSPSYCYFLIRLSKLINSDVALQNSSMPISFVRNNFKRIEEYVRNQQQQPVLEEEWNM